MERQLKSLPEVSLRVSVLIVAATGFSVLLNLAPLLPGLRSKKRCSCSSFHSLLNARVYIVCVASVLIMSMTSVVTRELEMISKALFVRCLANLRSFNPGMRELLTLNPQAALLTCIQFTSPYFLPFGASRVFTSSNRRSFILMKIWLLS